MYRYYRKNGYDVMHYKFYSINEFLSCLENNPICSSIFKDPDSISGSYDFTKTNSFEEAVNLCRYGYQEDFSKLVELKIKLEKFIKLSNKRNKQYNDYVGYVPDVKAYLEGNPLSMINRTNPSRKKIDIYLNTSFSSDTSKNAIFNRGAIVLTIVEILENLGYSVDLHLFEMSSVNNQLHFSQFILKPETERINPKKLYFPMCHPSWVRRLNFRLIEETSDATEIGWATGYGTPSKIQTIKKIIDLNENDIVIPTIDELNINGCDIIKDTNSVFEYINSLGAKDFELEKVKTFGSR